MLVAVGVVSCASTYEVSVSPTPATYVDPFEYCAAVGTVDTPDARYTGEKTPEAIVTGLQKALNASDAPIEWFTNGSFWRCMNGKVYGCFVGGNLPCEAKADTERAPTQAEKDFCAQNPNSDFIPMVVTGRETVYEWRCTNGVPEIVRQFVEPDAAGFLSNIWYEIGQE
jgi:hypothetical protein